jgi:homoserine dehydrogenase
VEARYYLRFDVRDQPGVLGLIATELGRSRISVEQVVQEGRGSADEAVPILIITHVCKEGDVRAALSKVARAEFMVRAPRLLRIEAI